MNILEKRHALVTGGGSGVGARIALTLAEAGAAVTIAGRRREALDAIASRHDRIHGISANITHEDDVALLFEEAVAQSGAVDIVVANAGAASSAPFAKWSLDDWNAMLGVNLTGTFLTLRQAAPSMLEQGYGRMICIASTAGLKGYSYVAPYCAAKHGVVGLVRALALEYARKGITVNALCPGFTESPMLDESIANIVATTGRSEADARKALSSTNPMGRFIAPREVAQAVLWLCGPNSDSVNGQALGISGGEI
jgi:3-hydroxybutyrate dehydrogenase